MSNIGTKRRIDALFPTLVGYSFNAEHNPNEKKWADQCLKLSETTKRGGTNWIANKTYNTEGTLNLWSDPVFDNLNQWVLQEAVWFCKDYGINWKTIDFKKTICWFNIYKKYDYQDVHIHQGSALSAIYFIKGSPNCAKTYLLTPHDTGPPIPMETWGRHSQETIWNYPDPGQLMIFRSHVHHAVGRQETDDPRISLSYNFYLR